MKAIGFFACIFSAWWLVENVEWPTWVGFLGFVGLSVGVLVTVSVLLRRLF
jgi:hypothetical protein